MFAFLGGEGVLRQVLPSLPWGTHVLHFSSKANLQNRFYKWGKLYSCVRPIGVVCAFGVSWPLDVRSAQFVWLAVSHLSHRRTRLFPPNGGLKLTTSAEHSSGEPTDLKGKPQDPDPLEPPPNFGMTQSESGEGQPLVVCRSWGGFQFTRSKHGFKST